MRQQGCGYDHVATIVEGYGNCRLAWRIPTGEHVGTTPTFHPSNRDSVALADGRNFPTHKIEVAHSIKIGIVCDTSRAITRAELGTDVKLDLAAAIGRFACKCAAGPPLINREWPLPLS